MILMKIMFYGKEMELDNKTRVVYAIHVGDLVLVGSGKFRRRTENKSKLKCNRHHCQRLQDEYNKTQDYHFELIDIVENDDKAREIEQYYIDKYRLIYGDNLCNVRKASNGATSKAYNKYNRLTEEDVVKIKALLSEKSNKELAEIFNCSSNAISKIRHNNRWVNA